LPRRCNFCLGCLACEDRVPRRGRLYQLFEMARAEAERTPGAPVAFAAASCARLLLGVALI